MLSAALSFSAAAHAVLEKPSYALTGLDLLKGAPASLKVLEKDAETGTAVVYLDPAAGEFLSRRAHEAGRCGGFEALSELGDAPGVFSVGPAARAQARSVLAGLRERVRAEQAVAPLAARASFPKRDTVVSAVALVQASNIRDTVTWFSNFPSRFNRGADANVPVQALRDKVKALVAGVPGATVDLIDHVKTPQKSVRVRIPGKARASEVVVLGGHLDSIVGWGGGPRAPGADDNASGTSSLVEALRILALPAADGRPALLPAERTIEFFFYAGEESGLLGSAEIAQDYRNRNVDVVGVLQLDMTLFPGSGALKIASMTDFTSAWMRNFLVEINRHYVGATILEDKCGYGCSDHASWFRRGYPAVMPFEAAFDDMNRNIHTTSDVIDSRSDFEHAASFSKLAIAMAVELGNTTERPPTGGTGLASR
jgi:leucyl aminopeptidase